MAEEESETVARTLLKIKNKLIDIACLNDDTVTALLDIASNFRIKFHDKEFIKKECMDLS
jgi:hypothetical protein